MHYSTFLLDSLKVLQRQCIQLEDLMSRDSKNTDKYIALIGQINKEEKWRQDALAQEIQSGNYPD